MVPAFTLTGHLPPGIHAAGWAEFVERFGWNAHRRSLISGISLAARMLRRANCRRLFVDGSFATSKAIPSDWDGAWDVEGVDPQLVDPVLLTFDADSRCRQRMKYGSDLFPTVAVEGMSGLPFTDFFQIDRTGISKGLVVLDLTAMLHD